MGRPFFIPGGVSINPPRRGTNDDNDFLLRDLQCEREQKPNRRKAVFL